MTDRHRHLYAEQFAADVADPGLIVVERAGGGAHVAIDRATWEKLPPGMRREWIKSAAAQLRPPGEA